MIKKGALALLVFVMIGYALYHQFAPTQKKETQSTKQTIATNGIEIGQSAPDFELQTIEGKTVKLTDLKGKKVIVNFWATWCPPCKKEMPEMQAFYEKHKDAVEIVAVNYTVSERTNAQEKVKSFIEEQHLTFPVVLDTTTSVSNVYKVLSLPTSYFVDTKGIIQQKYIGPMTESYMEKTLTHMQ